MRDEKITEAYSCPLTGDRPACRRCKGDAVERVVWGSATSAHFPRLKEASWEQCSRCRGSGRED